MSGALYNEIEPYCVEWLRNLVLGGHIAPGEVDNRSIVDLKPEDLEAAQFHAFAGIGVWSYALRLAGWPDDLPVWTGSCPCQPFSSAGSRKGLSDDRHLWPVWFSLIAARRPPVVFGEQVATGGGADWLDGVAADFAQAGYAFRAVDLCASVLGYPRRQRFFFVAYTDGHSQRDVRLHAEAPRVQAASDLVADELLRLHDLVPVGDGAPSRMGERRAYGNAINAQVAATFIRAVMDTWGWA